MKTRILIVVLASATTLLSFSLISGSPKKTGQENVAASSATTPVGGLVENDVQR